MSWAKVIVGAVLAAALVLVGVQIGERRAGGKAEKAAPAAPIARRENEMRSPVLRYSPALRSVPANPGLEADLRSSDPRVRSAAIVEAANAGANLPLIVAAARDPETAPVAIGALARLYEEGAIGDDVLVERAIDQGLPAKTRLQAWNGLAKVPSPVTAALFVDVLRKGDVSDRQAVAVLLSSQDPVVATPALIDALGDADEFVRLNAHASLTARSRGRDFGEDQRAWRTWWNSVRD